jgi:perosamine synthetase
MIPVYKPSISKKSTHYANDAIKSSWISSTGKYIDLASEKLSKIGGYKFVLLTNNGTSATHLVIRALKRQHPGIKRILVPSACYVAAYNSLVYDNNNWDIECVDLNLDTWNMEIKEVRQSDAIFAVHNLGNIINVPNLKDKFKCPVVEDNCEGLFGSYNNQPSGTKSLCSSLSFYGNKNITCGEGGAFLTNDEDIYNYALKLRGQGQSSSRFVHDELGYNYRMTNIQAALLLGQLEDSKAIMKDKERVFKRYKENLKNVKHIKIQEEEQNTSHSRWMFGVRFVGYTATSKSSAFFQEKGIDTRPMFYSYKVHKHLNFHGEDKNATIINKEVLVFPSFPDLSNLQIDYICENIITFAKQYCLS